MNKITITAGKQRNTIEVDRGSSNVSVDITKDLSAYYSKVAEDWATRTDGLVDNKDYSAKYYAHQSKESAEVAKDNANVTSQAVETVEGYANEVIEIITGFDATAEQAKEEVLAVAEQEKKNVTTVVTQGKQEIVELSVDEKQDIVSVGTQEKNKVQTQGQTSINSIKSEASGAIKDIDDRVKKVVNPIGAIIPVNASANYVPDGCLLCDGAEYSENQFSDLFYRWLYTGLGWKYQYNGLIEYENEPVIIDNLMSFTSDFTHFDITSDKDFTIYFNLYDVSGEQYLCCNEIDVLMSKCLLVKDNALVLRNPAVAPMTDTYITSASLGLYIKKSDTVISVSEDGVDWVEIPNFAVSNGCEIGSSAIHGFIDLSKSYVDNTRLAIQTPVGLLNVCTYEEYEQDLATYGQCGKFAVDIENGNFRVPTIKDGAVIQQALSDSELGKSYNAGLPNITGDHTTVISAAAGAFTQTHSGDLYDKGDSGGTGSWGRVYLDASLSNSIYGNSDTVQPNAIALRYFVVVANGQTNQSMMDWSAWASSLQGKADKTAVDGQWVAKTAVLTQSVTAGVTEIDMSEYLPQDNYQYEVLLLCTYADSGENYIKIYSDIIPQSTIGLIVNSSGTYNGSYINLPIGKDRVMYQYLKASANSGTDRGIEALAYRRLGINQ